MTVDSSGTIAFANTLTSGQDLANAQTTTVSGTPDSDGGCDFDFSSSALAAVSSSSYTEETAVNPATCQETLVSGTLTSAGAAALASDATPDAAPDTTTDITPDTTSTPASTTIQDTTVDTTPSQATGTPTTGAATGTTAEAGSAATSDGLTAAGTWAAFNKTSFVDPLDITITSLTNNLTWSGNGGPASGSGRITGGSTQAVSYNFPFDNWSAGPFGFSWSGCIGCNSLTSRDSRTFKNTDFEQVIIALLGAAGEAACGFTTAPAVFQLTPATTGYPNGFFGWGWTSHVSGGCSDLVHFRENRGGGHSS